MDAKEEAIRLESIFGCKTPKVIDEIKKYDKGDSYFWDEVKSEYYKL